MNKTGTLLKRYKNKSTFLKSFCIMSRQFHMAAKKWDMRRDSSSAIGPLPPAVQAVSEMTSCPNDLILKVFRQLTDADKHKTGSSFHDASPGATTELELFQTRAVDGAAAATSRSSTITAASLLVAVEDFFTKRHLLTSGLPLSSGDGKLSVDNARFLATSVEADSEVSQAETYSSSDHLSDTGSTSASSASDNCSRFNNKKNFNSPTNGAKNAAAAMLTVPLEGATIANSEKEEARRKLREKIRALKSENRMLKDRQFCRHCQQRPVTLTLLPCGHFCFCQECGSTFDTCPICRKTILADVKTILS